ncbi:hypothetical protein CSOJ01_05750 [Colletotrichum sojae]|uniref:Uncharacterized protein n=1 Tax=Colletotrichum sojae TaxID=2175907 RepID=A0A8H6MX36_9PEZI|nr:hypothetical protein CSOJ01_05750 [Colletotrichum sojae]
MATSTTTIHVHTSPSASKSELGNHTELNGQGVNRSNKDPGSMASRLDAVEKAKREFDGIEIARLKEERTDLSA